MAKTLVYMYISNHVVWPCQIPLNPKRRTHKLYIYIPWKLASEAGRVDTLHNIEFTLIFLVFWNSQWFCWKRGKPGVEFTENIPRHGIETKNKVSVSSFKHQNLEFIHTTPAGYKYIIAHIETFLSQRSIEFSIMKISCFMKEISSRPGEKAWKTHNFTWIIRLTCWLAAHCSLHSMSVAAFCC